LLFVSDRGVSCLRQPYHDAWRVSMDWNQIRESLENDETSGLASPDAFEDSPKFYKAPLVQN
jgi:hypothetical protein